MTFIEKALEDVGTHVRTYTRTYVLAYVHTYAQTRPSASRVAVTQRRSARTYSYVRTRVCIAMPRALVLFWQVPSALINNLCAVHFATVPASLLRCRPADFGAISAIDRTHPYVKVALVISLYLGASGGTGNIKRQAGGVASFCGSIRKDCACAVYQMHTYVRIQRHMMNLCFQTIW